MTQLNMPNECVSIFCPVCGEPVYPEMVVHIPTDSEGVYRSSGRYKCRKCGSETIVLGCKHVPDPDQKTLLEFGVTL